MGSAAYAKYMREAQGLQGLLFTSSANKFYTRWRIELTSHRMSQCYSMPGSMLKNVYILVFVRDAYSMR